MTDPTPLTLTTLNEAVAHGAALRARVVLQPAGGPGAKVFPPTYVADDNDRHGRTRYATEVRRIDGRDVPCVLLDSVASQANRMEEALLAAWRAARLDFPLVAVDFAEADGELPAPVGQITALEAPHRIYDAILRDSVDDAGTLFRYTAAGQAITQAGPRDATALFHYCPTALIFGAWDSTGPKGGLGSKFPRILASEIVGVDARPGTKVGGRLDPLGIVKKAGPLYAAADEAQGWTIAPDHKKAKALNPSDINHGNVAPSRDDEAGGVTLDHALQTTVLSLPALRRLQFRYTLDRAPLSTAAAAAAHTALAALALAALAHAHAAGHDLRSGTLLVPETPLIIEQLGANPAAYTLDPAQADALVAQAAAQAAAHGLAWVREPLPPLKPAPKLVQLVQASQQLSAREPAGEDA